MEGMKKGGSQGEWKGRIKKENKKYKCVYKHGLIYIHNMLPRSEHQESLKARVPSSTEHIFYPDLGF